MYSWAIPCGLGACLLFAACSQPEPGTPMEFSKACSVGNEKKVVEIGGFLSAGPSVMCSNRSGRTECGLRLAETATAPKGLSAYIKQGDGANSVEKPPKSYRREDVKIRDNGGNPVKPDDRVKVTGKMSVTPDLSVCFVDVTKIER